MFTDYFFPDSSYSQAFLDNLVNMFDDAEVHFPADQLLELIQTSTIPLEVFSYDISRYAVFRGAEIASQDSFYDFIKQALTKEVPGTVFWRAYDALLRGKLDLFQNLWTLYVSIELKNYPESFLHEALVIPEDPIFLNVAPLVHEHQQRLIKQFVLKKTDTKDITDQAFDDLLATFLEESTLLLSFFRLFQSSFERTINFSDLDNLLALLTDDTISSLGPYWESRFLTAICYWKSSLGLVFDVVDNLTHLKNLNSIANNFLIESQIFHIEALIAFKNNTQDYIELLQSAYYLAKEYDFFYQSVDVLLSKCELEPDTILQTIEEVFSFTEDDLHPLIRARFYAILGSHYIQAKNWDEAEKYLLQSSKLVQGSYDKRTYYQVIADFSYVLVITRQLQDALESSVVLLDDNVSILYRIRGFYLYGLTLLLMNQKTEAIEIIEEGIRVALTHKEHISLPWFYELLELIYFSQMDLENASRYSNLTYKAYFESSDAQGGFRAKLCSSYLLAFEKDFGHASTQVTGLLNDASSVQLQTESYLALQSILLGSKENIDLKQFSGFWDTINDLEKDVLPTVLLSFKNDLLHSPATMEVPEIPTMSNDRSFREFCYVVELEIYKLLNFANYSLGPAEWQQSISRIKTFLKQLQLPFSLLEDISSFMTKLESQTSSDSHDWFGLSVQDEQLVYEGIFFIGFIRNLLDNLPFNFLIDSTA